MPNFLSVSIDSVPLVQEMDLVTSDYYMRNQWKEFKVQYKTEKSSVVLEIQVMNGSYYTWLINLCMTEMN